MLEVYYGNSNLRDQATALGEALRSRDVDGKLLIGYPVISDNGSESRVDAVLNSPKHGVVLFLFRPVINNEQQVNDEQDSAVFQAQAFLSRSPHLRRGRRLAVPVNAITVLPVSPSVEYLTAARVDDGARLRAIVDTFEELEPEYAVYLTAALQTVTTIKPFKKRQSVAREDSRGAVIKKIEKNIANLDQWQQAAAIETPDGPQRIRGLAGSGKTIVLALKAAYLAATKPNWRIAVVFYSRALDQQFRDLIRRFYFEQRNDEPDWSRISVMPAWGSPSSPGLYAEIASANGQTPRTFIWARQTFGQDLAFQGTCDELMGLVKGKEIEGPYDAILIDEAQDLPVSFFRLAYGFCREPKRIAFAYDELQTLSEATMPAVGELFGVNSAGEPLVTLTNPDHGPRRDVVLPRCYRNTPWALSTAHALGLGVYSPDGLVQHFDDPALWTDIGYAVVNGDLDYDHDVTLERAPDATPAFFTELLRSEDAVTSHQFANEEEQAKWVAESIARDINEGELDADDVLVIYPEARTAQSRSGILAKRLRLLGLASHLVGVGSSREEVFVPGSVAMAHIHRSKGNEAPMVYVMNAEEGISDYRRVSARNVLFTAITRSRAWVRVCGVGARMGRVIAEINEVRNRAFRLSFHIPTREQLERMKTLSRDLSPKNENKLKRSTEAIKELIELVRSGEIYMEQIPAEFRPLIEVVLESDE